MSCLEHANNSAWQSKNSYHIVKSELFPQNTTLKNKTKEFIFPKQFYKHNLVIRICKYEVTQAILLLNDYNTHSARET